MEREREKGISDNVVDAFPFVLLHLKDIIMQLAIVLVSP